MVRCHTVVVGACITVASACGDSLGTARLAPASSDAGGDETASQTPPAGLVDAASDGSREAGPDPIVEREVAFDGIAFAGVRAPAYAPSKLATWHPFHFGKVLEATGPALRNVYATEVFHEPNGTRLFFGGWDTADAGDHTDRTFSATSDNFLRGDPHEFAPPRWEGRRLEITDESGTVANDPSAVSLPDGGHGLYLSVAVPPDTIALADGGITFVPKPGGTRIEMVTGAPGAWSASKPNAANALRLIGTDGGVAPYMHRPSVIREGNLTFLYYDRLGDPSLPAADQGVRVATSTNGVDFEPIGLALDVVLPDPVVSSVDVERFAAGWFMAYDGFITRLSFALGSDGKTFTRAASPYAIADSPLTEPFAITNPTILRDGDRLTGVVFGAFPRVAPSDATCPGTSIWDDGIGNRFCIERGHVSALFLQRKVVFRPADGSAPWDENEALDEDRLVLKPKTAPSASGTSGTLEVYDADGTTLLMSRPLVVRSGRLYSLTLD